MQFFDNTLKRKGSDLSDDNRTARMPYRSVPMSPSRGTGKMFEDLGSTGFTVSKPAASQAKKRTRNRAHAKQIAESSDDEMDLLSSGASHRSDEEEEPLPKGRKKGREKSNVNGVVVTHSPRKKLPTFKKKTQPASSGSSSHDSPMTPSTSLPSSSSKEARGYGILSKLKGNENDAVYEIPDDDANDTLPHPSTPPGRVREFPMMLSPLGEGQLHRKGKGKARDASLPASSPPYSDASSHRPPLRDTRPNARAGKSSSSYSSKARRTAPSDASDLEEPTPRAKPVRSKNGARKGASGTTLSTERLPTRKMQPRDTTNDARVIEYISSDSSRPSSPEACRPKLKAAAFPCLPPLNEPDTSSSKAKGKQKATSAFPDLSPLKTPRVSRKSKGGFPILSPLSSPVHSMSQRTRISVMPSKSLGSLDFDEDDEEEGRPALQPFPMVLSQFASREDTAQPPDDIMGAESPSFADDSMLDTSIDPSTLCPYCDEVLPPVLTPHFHSLLATAKRKSYAEPRPGNARGLKAPLGAFVAVCRRHRFEAHEVPKARARGWPTKIDFERLRERVERLARGFSKLVNGDAQTREQSTYWSAVMAEVQAKGSRAVAGLKGQFESFEKTQPGYYGELGSMVLHQTIYNLYPPSSFDAQSIAPLTPPEFIQRILVPETAVALIMEDTAQSRSDAMQTMHESATYGVAMFPDDAEGGRRAGAGEEIVRERALARRRELDVEERVEEAMLRDGDRAKPSAKPKPRRLGKGGAEKGQFTDSASEVEAVVKQPRASARRKVVPDPEQVDQDGYASRSSNASSVRRSTRTKANVHASTSKAGSKPKPVRAADFDDAHDLCTTSDLDMPALRTQPTRKKGQTPIIVSDSDDVEIIEKPTAVEVPEPRKSRPRARLVPRSAAASSDTDRAHPDEDEDADATPKASSQAKARASGSSSNYIPLLAALKRDNEPLARKKSDEKARRQFTMGEEVIPVLDSDEENMEVEVVEPIRAHRASSRTRRGRSAASDSWLLSDPSSQST